MTLHWPCRPGLLLLLALCSIAATAEPAPMLLWPDGAPGSQGHDAPEQVRLSALGEHIVTGVHRPSITPYLPAAGLASGAAVIVIPGGGHRELWMDHEGYRVGRWLSDHGIAAFVLKYRLAQEPGSTYTIEGDELADVQRALRLVRSEGAQWHVDAHRLGVLGFSAGGELAALVATRPGAARPGAADPIERESAVPDFMALIYPAIPKDMTLSAATPAAFLLCGDSDSPAIAQGVPNLFAALKAAGASAELHVLAGIGHGFGIRAGNPPAVAEWPWLFYRWLDGRGLLTGGQAGLAPISEPMRTGFPGAHAVAEYSDVQLVAAAQATLAVPSPPTLVRLAALTPDVPFAIGGAHLSFWKPSFVLGNADGGEAGVNFWNLYNEGHINVGFVATGAAATLMDCRMLSSSNFGYRIYAGDPAALGIHGQAPLVSGHLLLLVAAGTPAGEVSVELWPSAPRARIGFFGCDLWRVE
jgi:acetyl esterase/lipase